MKRKISEKNWERVFIGYLIISLIGLGAYTLSVRISLNQKKEMITTMMKLYGQAILELPLTEYEKNIVKK